MRQTNLPFFLNEHPESKNIEFKSGTKGRLPKDIWKTISAFSNTDGGQIVFGIDPNGNNINLSKNDIDKLQTDFANLCEQSFNVPIIPDIQFSDGVLIAFIATQPAQLRPIYSKSRGAYTGSYIRIGSSNHQTTDEDIRRFSVASIGGSETISYTDRDYNDYFDERIVEQYISIINKNRNNIYQHFSTKEILIKLQAIDRKGDPTLFGILALGKPLSQSELIAPTVNITVTVYPGYEKVDDSNLHITYVDNREFTGDIVLQFNSAFRFVKSVLPVRGYVDDAGIRQDLIIIPEIALREALANAVAHRDYTDHTSAIQVDIFTNRVEITNPGKSIVPINELEATPSATRNPLLMSFLKDYGVTEQKARGIRTIIVSMKNAGLAKPEFANVGSFFKSTLFATAFKSSEDREWLARYDGYSLNNRQKNALVYIKNKPSGISNREYREINGMNQVRDDKKANKELRQLVDKAILKQVGDNRARKYTINE